MTPQEAKDMYCRQIADHGETVGFRRYSGTGASRLHADIEARARVMGYKPHQLVGNIQQGDVRIVVLEDDLQSATPTGGTFTLPLRKGDKAIVRGKEINIEAVDLTTRSVAGVLIAPDIQARG